MYSECPLTAPKLPLAEITLNCLLVTLCMDSSNLIS